MINNFFKGFYQEGATIKKTNFIINTLATRNQLKPGGKNKVHKLVNASYIYIDVHCTIYKNNDGEKSSTGYGVYHIKAGAQRRSFMHSTRRMPACNMTLLSHKALWSA